MTERELAVVTLESLPFTPNDEQVELVAAFAHFCCCDDQRAVFLLNGYAGTGKTSVTGALVRALKQLGRKVVLLAPTGRAAMVFHEHAGHPAFTIHRRIYRQNSYLSEGFALAENKHEDTVFIVDEASMIANAASDGITFGSGRLLDDLVTFVYNGRGCRLALIGDKAQLPPVGCTESPALTPDVLRGYGLNVYTATLRQIARQAEQSGILQNATMLRRIMESGTLTTPRLELEQYDDISAISSEFLMETISDCYDRDGIGQTIIITRSNKRAMLFNGGIRNQILYREDLLVSGDLLLVAKNNYFWTADCDDVDFIANGDVVRVWRVWGETEHRYGLQFANVTVELPDHDGMELDVKIVLDCLTGEHVALSREQQERLFNEIMAELEGNKQDRFKALKANPYFNALQVKFAYAVTCHKAQGGQWKNVFIDMGAIMPEAFTTIDFFRWLYTAITRAQERVYLINCPIAQ